MRLLNISRVRQKAADIRQALLMLRTLSSRSEAEFLADAVVVAAAKYELLVAAEAALDLCGHICAKRLGKAPVAYPNCFQLLAEGGVISVETGRRLAAMARFRNLLLHQYGEIDDKRLYSLLKDHRGDLDTYLAEIGRHLGEAI